MTLHEIETASRFAWPALEEQELPFGVLRYGAGVHRRSNSLNLFFDAQYNEDQLLEETERFFRERKLPAIVKVLDLSDPTVTSFCALDSYLASNQYELEAPTLVMSLDLSNTTAEQCCPEPVLNRSVLVSRNTWLEAWYGISNFDSAELQIHQQMLGKVDAVSCFLLARDSSGNAISCGMATLCDGALGIFGIVTDPNHRGQGYAGRLIQSLLHWGKQNSARYAFLQVEAVNTGAAALYQKLGFSELYSYWYRVKNLH